MSDGPAMVRWLLDTRRIWQSGPLKKNASRALRLLKPEEQAAVDRYFQIKDAKMCLASYLLKYLVIVRLGSVPWADVVLSEGRSRKPCYVPKHSYRKPVQFNVSHQAGLVAMVGHGSGSSKVGVDIVCINERNGYGIIDSEGFDGWVNMYREVFSSQEMDDMKNQIQSIMLKDGTVVFSDELVTAARCCKRNTSCTIILRSGEPKIINSNIVIDAKLRRFYAFWCLKEAYIKMTGEALLADWLRDLEFRNVRAPWPATASGTVANRWGETVKDVEIWFEGKRIKNVRIELQAFEEDYLVATASTDVTPGSPAESGNFPIFEELNIQEDIYLCAERV
ncbi:MAG: hypothetical protein M1836_003441 [Candelina mexicana]|nr:MAG: hypothetical protein M1836_003441 [Candelina mexicana]